MNLLRDVLEELYSMFASDLAMSLGVVLVIGAAAAIRHFVPVNPALAGLALVTGCLALLIWRVSAAIPRKL